MKFLLPLLLILCVPWGCSKDPAEKISQSELVSAANLEVKDLKSTNNEVKHHYSSGDKYLGGVFSTNTATYKNINGFPNNIWGWGGEDNDIMYRINALNIPVNKNRIYYRWDKPKEVFDNLTPSKIIYMYKK